MVLRARSSRSRARLEEFLLSPFLVPRDDGGQGTVTHHSGNLVAALKAVR